MEPNVSSVPNTPIVFCADDFGMSPAINQGIIALARAGRLSATSCMSKGAAFKADFPVLAGLPIQKGLHLNLTEALEAGQFWQPLARLIRQCYIGGLDRQRVQREIDEQLDAFESALGAPPDYVDGHQHVHQFPVVRDCLIATLTQRYGARLPWLRSTYAPRRVRALAPGLRLKARVIEALGAQAFLRNARQAGFASNGHLLGAYDFSGGAQGYAALLEVWLSAAVPGDVLMCHPAEGIDATDPLGVQRNAEFTVLASEAFCALLARSRVCVALG